MGGMGWSVNGSKKVVIRRRVNGGRMYAEVKPESDMQKVILQKWWYKRKVCSKRSLKRSKTLNRNANFPHHTYLCSAKDTENLNKPTTHQHNIQTDSGVRQPGTVLYISP